MIERVYRCLLRGYPASFRALFADEMRAVFAQRLQDARQQQRLVDFCAQEVFELLRSIAMENFTRFKKNTPESPQRIALARRILQITAVLVFLVYLGMVVLPRPLEGDVAVFLLFNVGVMASLALTLWRERLGGVLMTALSALWWAFLFVTLSSSIPLPIAAVGALIPPLPYMLIGALYVRIAKQAALVGSSNTL